MSHDDGNKKGLQYSSTEPGSTHKSDADLESIRSAADRRCPIGSTLNHVRTRALYVVTDIALREEDLEPLVVYRRYDSNVRFARPLEEFLERFEFNTRPTVRR